MENFTLSTKETGVLAHLSSGRKQPTDVLRDRDDRTASVIFESFSDDGPFRRLTDEEARRHVIFAYFYCGFLGAAFLSVLIWH